MKHSKQKGNLGYSATIKELHRLGLNVFTELGDNSKIDLIVEFNKSLVKLQIKYVTENENTVTLPLRKSGPNGYRYTYADNDVDVFSVYLPVRDKVIFIPSKLACKNSSMFVVRLDGKKPINGHSMEEFDDLKKVLTDTISHR